ncbi:hypothetical protein M0R45_003556 [Rubus argutus]|uniref:Uncharacterized protein n=1 Tax=Rubus argutus TaxID=59490 RepID=A0AAW1YFS1_RUBAR
MATGVLRMVIVVSMLVLVLARNQLGDDAVYQKDDAPTAVDHVSSSSLVNSNTNDNEVVVPNINTGLPPYCLAKCFFNCIPHFLEFQDCYQLCVVKCQIDTPPASLQH